jgi:hypothetical protein
MKGKSLSLWQRMKISQKLPLEFETKLIEFQRFVIGLCWRNNYSLSQNSNADKTAVFFQHTSQLYHKFQRGKTSGNENYRLRKVTCYRHTVCNHRWQ